jgi:7-carboxy-7-deazaguanine synthase
MNKKNTANISEIFSSIQGEGIFCGQRHLFIRFCGCNLRCDYCDTKENLSTNNFKSYSLQNVLKKIKKFDLNIHKAVVLTGGEPLLSFEFIKKLIPKIKKENKNIKIFLETNGTLPSELSKVIKNLDIISCDIKLSQYQQNKIPKNIFSHQKQFIKTLVKSKKCFYLKIVIDHKLKKEMLKKFLGSLEISCDTNIVIQPIMKAKSPQISGKKLDAMQIYLLKKFKNVLVILQIHKILGIN